MCRNRLIEEMNAYYGHLAPWHDEYMSYTSNADMERLLTPLIEIVEPLVRDRDVLEIACGTGNWTQVLAKRARSVLATDLNEAMLTLAGKKTYAGDVTFRVADAYDLDDVGGKFTAAFASDWWSHVPKANQAPFLNGLHRRLAPGANVVLLDMSFRDVFEREEVHYDADGNRISRRRLPDGQEYFVVKNFPDEEEIRRVLANRATNIVYYQDEPLKRWMVTYTTK